MKVLKVKGTNMFDVFQGDGWEQHTRVRRVRHRGKFGRNFSYHYVSGIVLNTTQIFHLLKGIE